MEASLSILVDAIRNQLYDLFEDELTNTQIVIGPPHEAAKQQEKDADRDYLCVFLYRVGYSGFPADTTSDDPLYLKAFCMITALGGSDPGSGSACKTPGNSELKLIGAIAKHFHQHPELKLEDESGAVRAHLQIVPMQLTLDDINHLWATQNNTPYRLSLSYEFALLPVPMKARVERGPRVSSVSFGVSATLDPNKEVEKTLFHLQVPLVEVDIKNRPDWAPHICLLNNGEPTYTLEKYTPQTPVSLIVLGNPETPVSLEWEIWTLDKTNPPTGSWETGVKGEELRPTSASLQNATAIQVTVPRLNNNDEIQALLRAVRTYKPENGGASRTLVSNPVLITVGS
ncbi:MAG: DUF4255 domain-containing protein [Betaproteobacteria bacterium]|nr:DUF4255 domain-containing protein [Betaproteobacteria bacterium]